jgi:hypothetical protein
VGYQRTFWWGTVAAVAFATVAPSLLAQNALAQSWLPWTTRSEPERQPERRQAPPNYGQFRPPQQQQPWSGNVPSYGNRPAICLQLEQRLAQDAHRQANAQGTIQKLRQDLGQARREMRKAERELERRDCYETFLFTRSLRPSRACHQLDQNFRSASTRTENLSLELRQFESGGTSNQDEIVRALARNNCGANYQQAARERNSFSNFWQDNDGDGGRSTGNLFGGLPFATYRTVCVRLCDGYYFPVSFSTLPTHFARDLEACQSKCAAPTELYFHQNPGGSVEQMVSQRSQQPYTSLRTAFRYRKEFVAGCSCKATEYVPQDGSVVTGSQVPQPKPASPNTANNQTDKLSPVR